MSEQCWLTANGWGDAGYMKNPAEQAAECKLLRGNATCAAHSDKPSEQMQNLLKRFGVTTEAELLEQIALDNTENYEIPIEDARATAEVDLDRMLEAEYQRIEGGAYDR